MLEKHSGIWKFDASKLNQTQDNGTKIVTGLRQEPDVAWAHGAVYTVMNNRDSIDQLFPDHFTAEDNNEGPAEVMYRADPGSNFGWPYCYVDYRSGKNSARARIWRRRQDGGPLRQRHHPAGCGLSRPLGAGGREFL